MKFIPLPIFTLKLSKFTQISLIARFNQNCPNYVNSNIKLNLSIPHYFFWLLMSYIHWKYSLKTPSRWIVSYLSSVKKSNTRTISEVNKKMSLTSWGSNFMRSNLTSHMMVTKTPQKDVLLTIWGVSMNVNFDLKIDLIVPEPHYVKFFFFRTSSIVQMFEFLTFDK